jgi:DNA-binding NtrC family response regulator
MKRREIGTIETILLIDDEEEILDVLDKILTIEGYSTIKARNGQEGVTAAQDHPGEIHAVILDLKMPILNGPKAFPMLKKVRPNAKVIICTGHNIDAEIQSLLDAGAESFIKKPFMPGLLIDEIRKAIDSPN